MQKEKVADTKTKLHALMSSIPRAVDKSLLLQTLALFETLLAKIHDLQAENERNKAKVDKEDNYGNVVLELEDSRERLREAQKVGTEQDRFFHREWHLRQS